MLVLSRKKDEKVRLTVGDVQIEVTVVDVDRGRVRLGFEAPKELVRIFRTELLEQHDGRGTLLSSGSCSGVPSQPNASGGEAGEG